MLRCALALLWILSAVTSGCGDGNGAGGTGGSGGAGGVAGAGGMGGTTFQPGPTCIAFCTKVVRECRTFTFTQAHCEQGCERDLADERAVSEACGDAVEAVFQCAAELDCPDVLAWVERVPLDSYPCRPEVANVDVACMGN